MRSHHLQLYVSGVTWLAAAGEGALAPLSGMHENPSAQQWTEVAQLLRNRFKTANTASLILSARLCRFVVLPWVSSRSTSGAIRSSAAAAFSENHGVDDSTHRIEIHWPPYGVPILAVAYPRALVDTLRSALKASGCRLTDVTVSIDPILTEYGKDVGMGSSLLAYAEDDGVTGITLDEGHVVQVETLSGNGYGLDDATAWSSRKRFAFSTDEALRWLTTSAPPDAFAGITLPLRGIDKPVSPGHAVVAARL